MDDSVKINNGLLVRFSDLPHSYSYDGQITKPGQKAERITSQP